MERESSTTGYVLQRQSLITVQGWPGTRRADAEPSDGNYLIPLRLPLRFGRSPLNQG